MGEFSRAAEADRSGLFLGRRTHVDAVIPANPFGNVWLDLGREVFIHGSPLAGADLQRGCISLSPRDADDVYGILSVGSTVRILRRIIEAGKIGNRGELQPCTIAMR